MVGCRTGIVGVDGDRDRCMALEGMGLTSQELTVTNTASKTHVKLLRIR